MLGGVSLVAKRCTLEGGFERTRAKLMLRVLLGAPCRISSCSSQFRTSFKTELDSLCWETMHASH